MQVKREQELTLEKFAIIAKLMGTRDPARAAAKLVLVDGQSGINAARETGMSPQAVSNSVKRYRDADSQIRCAYTSVNTLSNL